MLLPPLMACSIGNGDTGAESDESHSDDDEQSHSTTPAASQSQQTADAAAAAAAARADRQRTHWKHEEVRAMLFFASETLQMKKVLSRGAGSRTPSPELLILVDKYNGWVRLTSGASIERHWRDIAAKLVSLRKEYRLLRQADAAADKRPFGSSATVVVLKDILDVFYADDIGPNGELVLLRKRKRNAALPEVQDSPTGGSGVKRRGRAPARFDDMFFYSSQVTDPNMDQDQDMKPIIHPEFKTP